MPQNRWIPTTLLAKELGVNPRYLQRNRLKLFKAGHHYRVVNPTSYRPTYRWHPGRCAALLEKETKQAAKIETSQQPKASGKGTQLPFIDGVESYEIH
ncbi:MAG: hypothetical protein AAGC93_01670 [Cyanobacteria bacterium P01_F01_bin.53]